MLALIAQGGTLVSDDECIVDPRGGCLDVFPSWAAYGLLAGLERRDTNVRLSIGPALAQSNRFDEVFSMVARFDGSAAMLWRFSVTGTVSGLLIPSYQGNYFYYIGAGLGLRIR